MSALDLVVLPLFDLSELLVVDGLLLLDLHLLVVLVVEGFLTVGGVFVQHALVFLLLQQHFLVFLRLSFNHLLVQCRLKACSLVVLFLPFKLLVSQVLKLLVRIEFRPLIVILDVLHFLLGNEPPRWRIQAWLLLFLLGRLGGFLVILGEPLLPQTEGVVLVGARLDQFFDVGGGVVSHLLNSLLPTDRGQLRLGGLVLLQGEAVLYLPLQEFNRVFR